MRGLGLFSVATVSTFAVFKFKEHEFLQSKSQTIGKPMVGGSFSLINHLNEPVTDETYAGKYKMIYFGFVNCPDVCPEEMEKMATVMDNLNSDKILGIFITCDPHRDSVDVVREYVSEFHPKIIGLTGSFEEIKSTAKKYRVYFSTPEQQQEKEYLVDHSIFIYFMDPNGEFIDVFGKSLTADEITTKIKNIIQYFSTYGFKSLFKSGTTNLRTFRGSIMYFDVFGMKLPNDPHLFPL